MTKEWSQNDIDALIDKISDVPSPDSKNKESLSMDEIDAILFNSPNEYIEHIGLDGKKYTWREIENLDDIEKNRYNLKLWDPGQNIPNGLKSVLSLNNITKKEINFYIEIINENNHEIFFMVSGFIENQFKFKNITTGEVQSGGISYLASGSNPGILLKPKEKIEKNIKFEINSNNENPIDSIQGNITITPGDYLAYYKINLDSNFFCTFSHTKYENLISYCKKHKLKLWEGNSISDIIPFTYK